MSKLASLLDEKREYWPDGKGLKGGEKGDRFRVTYVSQSQVFRRSIRCQF
jgi:hypothetical protein